MSALVDEIGRRGAHRLIDPAALRHHGGIGVSRCVTVLLTLAFNADARREVFWALGTIAAELGIPKTDVRNALAVLEASGLIERTGAKRGNGVVVYRFTDPDLWSIGPARPARGVLVDNSRDRAGDRAGNRAGNRAGYPALEGKGSENTTTTTVGNGYVGAPRVADGGGGGGDSEDSKSTPAVTSMPPADVHRSPEASKSPPEHQGSLMPVLQGGRSADAEDPKLVDTRRCLVRDLGQHCPRGWEVARLVQRAVDVDGWDWDFLIAYLLDAADTATKSAPGLIVDTLRGRPLPLPKQRADYDWTAEATASSASRGCDRCDGKWILNPDGKRSERLCECYRGGEVTAVDAGLVTPSAAVRRGA